MGTTKNKTSFKSFSAKTILEGMPELAYVFDKEGRMLMWNRNIELILGYTEKELHNKYILDFIDEADRERTLETMQRIFDEKTEQTIEYNLISKSGKKMPYLGSGSLATKGNEEFFIGMAIDISKFRTPDPL